jgi:NAD(P)-dependent dehydrogenase (short-subunit alcohol dehydrogenase family)
MTVALVTGCSSGFGEGAALALARKGVKVAAGVRDPRRAAGLAKAAQAENLPLELVTLDVTDDASVKTAITGVTRRLGPIDVLVNNAGVHIIAPAEHTTIPDAARLLDTNVLGPLRMMQAVLPDMRARKRGRIVNVTSGASFIAVPYMAVYSGSKQALDAMSAAMATELAPFGIEIVTVAPGTFRTAIVEKGTMPRETYGYSDHARALCERFVSDVENGPDPTPVFDAIAKAALDPAAKLRTLVGRDVQILVPIVEARDAQQAIFGGKG